ncbi:MAG: exodeoxyribonuclease VII small subunit [Candidatus Nomurabacteria bacterium]|nr:MAG: exodeoxyribonuclease VII small subunit [Candidatus Nomurabacteria bacterium]
MSKSDKTIQEKIEELDKLVAWFEGEDFELEQASTKLKEAAKLATEIERDLEVVANDIQLVKKSFKTDTDADV